MSSIKKLGTSSLAVLLVAETALACAGEGELEPEREGVPDASAEVADAGDAGDGADAADAADADPCSASGLCIVPVPIDTRVNVTSVSGSGAKDVWAVGTARTTLHYDGAVWEKADTIPYDAAPFTMRAVWVGGPNDVWVADGPTIHHSTGWKGPSATVWESSVLAGTYTAPTAISGNDGRVIIGRQISNQFDDYEAAIVTCSGWDAGGLLEPTYLENRHFRTNGTDGLWSIAMTGPNEAWGTSFPTTNGPGARVVRAHLASPGDGGEPDAGPSWQVEEYDSRTERNLYGVWGDEQAVWLVGEGGVIRRMTPANLPSGVFENVPSPVIADLRGIFGFGADDVWAVGDDATVLHWDGKVWSRLASPFDSAADKPRLFSVWGSAPNDVWIGGNGVILHFEGKAP